MACRHTLHISVFIHNSLNRVAIAPIVVALLVLGFIALSKRHNQIQGGYSFRSRGKPLNASLAFVEDIDTDRFSSKTSIPESPLSHRPYATLAVTKNDR